jgi:hypothetical protein
MAAEDPVEEFALRLQVATERIGHQGPEAPIGVERGAPPRQMNETVGAIHRQRTQQHLIDKRKDGGVDAGSQG